ncbi:MAG: pyrroline-5-carboxylate reductase [Erysipelotrichaceae bacterium]|nr:pyrroline-5-carboxylate reductase [Erysipelotrichaceae bacterium]
MKIGFIGLGNMAGTICQGLIKSDFIDGSEVYGYDINSQQLMMFEQDFGIHVCSSEQDVVKNCDYLVMGVKPNIVESVISKIKSVIDQQVIVSIVAGYGNDKYEELLPGTHHLTIMPNTPAKALEGTTLFEKDNTLTAEELNYVQTMFESIGEVYLIENYQMVAGGALSGCGPAFVYMFIEALADGAVLNGLPRDLAYKLASQTVLGSAKMVKETQLHPGILKDQVCSPGGITIQGVKALEENNFRNAVMEAIDRSKK